MITWTKLTPTTLPEKVVNGKDHYVLAFNPGLRGPSRFSVIHARHARTRPFSHWTELTIPTTEPAAPSVVLKDFTDI